MHKYDVKDLLFLMSRLREPDFGCPWDLKQNYKSITPSTIEEAYEVVDAIDRGDFANLREELGDLLFQVVFYGQLAKEEERFTFDDIVSDLTAKLVRRHPHVFPDGSLESRRESNPDGSAAELDDDKIKASWEKIKKEERAQKGAPGVLDDVPVTLTALSRAAKLQKRAANVGFDWPSVKPVIDKLEEEITELKCELNQAYSEHSLNEHAADNQSIEESVTKEKIAEEMGDVLFSCVNLARHLKVDAEQALRLANMKFERRFRYIEDSLNSKGIAWSDADSELMEAYWSEAKQKELEP